MLFCFLTPPTNLILILYLGRYIWRQHRWSKNLRKNLNKLRGSQYPVPCCTMQFIQIFSKVVGPMMLKIFQRLPE